MGRRLYNLREKILRIWIKRSFQKIDSLRKNLYQEGLANLELTSVWRYIRLGDITDRLGYGLLPGHRALVRKRLNFLEEYFDYVNERLDDLLAIN